MEENFYEANIRIPLDQYAYVEIHMPKNTQKDILDTYENFSNDYQKRASDPTKKPAF